MKTPLTFVMTETYEDWDNSDIEAGETSKKGFDYKGERYSVDELKEYIEDQGFGDPSEHPVTNRNVWLKSIGDPGFETGIQEVKHLHCDKILDADGNRLEANQEEKIWTTLVRQSTEVDYKPSGYEI